MSAATDAQTLLHQKELEVAGLREAALRQLEAQLLVKQQELSTLNAQFDQLKQDFRYNLSLLEDRDAELEKYDSETAILAAALADKEQQLVDLQKSYADALFDLKSERAKHSEAEFVQQAKRMELRQQLDDERILHAELMLRHKEECEQAKRLLQHALSETQEELLQQRRELIASFDVQVQQLEAKYKHQADDAAQEAASALQLARVREDEAKAARQREADQIAVAGAALASEREKDKSLKALTLELEQTKRLAEQQAADLTEQIRTLKQVSKGAAEVADAQLSSMASELAAAKQQLAELSAQSASSLARQQSQAREEAALLRVKMEQLQARNLELEAEARELQGHLRTLRRDMQGKVESMEQELRLLKETSDMALTDYEQRREAEVAELREQLWAEQQNSRSAKDKAESLRNTLEERAADITGLKERLAACGARERELQRKLVEVELKLEQQVEARQAAMDAEDTACVKQLAEQRDAAVSALQDAQSRLLDKESELGKLRDLLQQLSPGRGAAALPPQRPAGQRAEPTAAAEAATVQAEAGQQLQQQKQPQGSFRHRAQPLLVDLPHRAPQESMDLVSEHMSAFPSPSMLLLEQGLSPRIAGSPLWTAGPLDATSKAVLSARIDQLVRTSDDALRPRNPSRLGGLPLDSPTAPSSPGDTPGRTELLAAAAEQNLHLRSTLAAMREEMVALQHAVAAPLTPGRAATNTALPDNVAVLQAELQESDRDVRQALEHVEVLQRQLSMLQQQHSAGAGSAPVDAEAFPELQFLRHRVQQLMAENRAVRRQVLQLKLTDLAPGQESPAIAATGAVAALFLPGGWKAEDAMGPDPSSRSNLAAAEATVADLQRQLADATAQLRQSQGENERLMELSNALRAERERLVALIAAWGLAPADDGGIEPLMPPHARSPSPSRVLPPSRPLPLPGSIDQDLPFTTAATLFPPATQPALQPQLSLSQMPTQAEGRSSNAPQGQQNSAVVTSSPPGENVGQTMPLTAEDAVADSAAAGTAAASTRHVHFFSDSSLHRGSLDSGEDVQQAQPAGGQRSRSGSPADRPPASANLQAEEFVQGSAAGVARPPASVPGSASSRETASQRSRLQSMQNKPRVRNYNIKQDAR